MHSTLCYNLQLQNTPGQAANSLYTRARKRGQRGHLLAGLAGRSQALLSLAEIRAACSVEAQSDAGIRTVSINQIRGSEDRCADFDSNFNPLQEHNRDRWLNIAQARERGKALPPVALIQVGDLYFVRDGHHRVSVARALGQQAIEATVVVWQVAGSLPWEAPAQAAASRLQGWFNRLLCGGTRLQQTARLRFCNGLAAVGAALRRPPLLQSRIDVL
jgi:hypothetical protein